MGAGIVFGLVALFGAYQSSQNAKNFHLALATATVLLFVMGYRFYMTGKFMPVSLFSIHIICYYY